jgi:hypothetical protein
MYLGLPRVVEQEIISLPVRSALFEQRIGGLVVKWMSAGEELFLCFTECTNSHVPW